MDWSNFILGTLAFTVMSALLYVWGYMRSRKVPQKLHEQMRTVLVEKTLQAVGGSSKGVTVKEVAGIIRNVTVGSQMQGYRLTVDKPQVTAEALLEELVNRGSVRVQMRGQTKWYILSNHTSET